MARPTKHTQELEDKLATALQNGLTIEAACDVVGMDARTFHRWMESGATGRGKFVQFCRNMKSAVATLKLTLISAINADPDWRAKAWVLERRFTDEYGRRNVTELVGKGGGPIKTEGAPPPVVIYLTGDGEDDPYTAPEPQKQAASAPEAQPAALTAPDGPPRP